MKKLFMNVEGVLIGEDAEAGEQSAACAVRGDLACLCQWLAWSATLAIAKLCQRRRVACMI